MKILLIHASAGAGHQKAAEAVHDTLIQNPAHNVTLIDALDYSSPWFKQMYKGSYSFLITKIPALWGVFFAVADVPILQPLIRVLRRVQNGLNTRKLHQYLIEQQFDVVISTHFMPNEVVSALKSQKKISSQLICCVTDYDVHRIWLAPHVDHYCAASGLTQKKLLQLGVEPARIHVTGIPSHANFSKSFDVPQLKSDMGLDPDQFTVLVATGSFGIGPIEEIITTLTDFQIIVVCGHNKSLFERLNTRAAAHVKVMGLVNNMHELMAVSDAMVSKPGGLSITEALVSHLPLVFFNAIPGQETNNIRVLKDYGVGISHCTIPEMSDKLNELRNSPERYQDAVAKIKEIAKPDAVQKIAAIIS